MSKRVAAWRAALSASGSEAKLLQRWNFLGWSREDALARLEGEELFPSPPVPGAQELLARSLSRFESEEIASPGEEAPFAEIFAVFAEEIFKESPPESIFFRSSLVFSLGEMAACALLAELRASLRRQPESSDLYRDFMEELRTGGLRRLFQRLPVLEHQLSILLHNAKEAAEEFLSRCAADRDLLKIQFPGAEGEILHLDTDCGDGHRSGRRVMIVTFATGRKVVYKPRNLRMDVAWHGLIQWMSARNVRCTLQAPVAIDRGDYGWLDYVEPAQPENPAEYYRSAGELLALTWLCGGSDFHEENLIATAGGPVLVDLETLFTPVARPFGAAEDELEAASEEMLFSSGVLSTLLLPVWQIDEQGHARDLSGLTGQRCDEAGWYEPQWVDLGTSRMRKEMRPAPSRPPRNIPCDADGVQFSATAFVDEVVSGFKTAACTLLVERGNLPVAEFRGAQIRFLVRTTKVYGIMRERLRDPKFLASAVDRSIEIEKLSRPFFPRTASAPKPEVFQCYEGERRGLEGGDIPVFHARTDETTLHGDGGIMVRDYFWKTGWDAAQQKLRRLDEALIEEQAGLVRSSLQLHYPASAPPPPADLMSTITAIADDLAQRAIPLHSGGISWLSLGFDPLRKMQTAGLMGLDLYSGSTGVAIFLAALARVTGDERWRALALESTRPRLDQMRDPKFRPMLLRMPLGIASGLGSLLLACQALANLLGDDRYLDDAEYFAQLIPSREMDFGTTHDVLGGGAGAIVALLNLYEKTQAPTLLESAAILGDRLLTERVQALSGHRVWQPEFAIRPLTGLGHGAAGLALALHRLGIAANESRFVEAAAEAVAYERAVFDPVASNWPDFRRGPVAIGENAFMHGWCAGGPGIGLARLAQFGGEDSAACDELEIAIQGALREPPLEVSHLCCGRSAGIELLLEASRLDGKSSLREKAAAQVAQMIEARSSSGFFPLNGADRGRLFAPSFFQGCCGIGYTFLRLVDETLPSIAGLQVDFQPFRTEK